MSVTSKGLLTRGLNALRDACKDYEDVQTPSKDNPSRSESSLVMHKTVEKALGTVKERWVHVVEEIQTEPDQQKRAS